MSTMRNISGFTLVELVIVIVILGIIGTIATRQMIGSIDDARYEQTKQELDHLAYAIAGNPAAYAGGARTDFGYVGDIGALPPTLTALAQNPGYSTWDGPYVDANGYLTDAWNVAYAYSGINIQSTGSGSAIDKKVAATASELLANSVMGFVTDANRQPPGTIYRDSITVLLAYPDGSGGATAAAITPSADGGFTFNNVPIGNHQLRVVYLPQADTMMYPVCVPPATTVKLDIAFPADLW